MGIIELVEEIRISRVRWRQGLSGGMGGVAGSLPERGVWEEVLEGRQDTCSLGKLQEWVELLVWVLE